MTRLRGISAAAAVFLVLLSSACAGSGGAGSGTGASGAPDPSGSGAPEPAQAGEAPVLRVEQVGGFAPAAANLSRIPMVSVYDDGRVIRQGAQIAIYPAPALPSVQVTTITPAGVQALIRKAAEAGVRTGASLGQPSVADAPTTRFTLIEGGATHRVDAVALNETAPDDPGVAAAQKAARAKLSAFVEQLTDLEGTLGAGQVTGTAAYRPAALAAVSTPWKPVDEPGLSAPPARPWPGPGLPGEPAGGAEMSCATVTGAAVDAVLAAAKDANALTPWTSGGKQWTVVLRPLLPDEADCAALRDA
jgi:hypothetical protein